MKILSVLALALALSASCAIAMALDTVNDVQLLNKAQESSMPGVLGGVVVCEVLDCSLSRDGSYVAEITSPLPWKVIRSFVTEPFSFCEKAFCDPFGSDFDEEVIPRQGMYPLTMAMDEGDWRDCNPTYCTTLPPRFVNDLTDITIRADITWVNAPVLSDWPGGNAVMSGRVCEKPDCSPFVEEVTGGLPWWCDPTYCDPLPLPVLMMDAEVLFPGCPPGCESVGQGLCICPDPFPQLNKAQENPWPLMMDAGTMPGVRNVKYIIPKPPLRMMPWIVGADTEEVWRLFKDKTSPKPTK
ncbi:MAG: hypothetical protein OXF88_24525 [Rhodobacteraceae bacterium]|nr:hypothetical protein [Paracoccaceae bacterium]